MPLTATTQLSPNVAGAYDRNLLDRLEVLLVHVGYGDEKPVPKNEGTQITWRRYANLSAATTALTEGVSPAGSQLSKTDYTAALAQYGDFVVLTDWLKLTGLDKTVLEAQDIQSYQASDTVDQLTRDVMAAGTQQRLANGSVTTDVNTVLAIADVQYAQNLLERVGVMPIKERVLPGLNYNTFSTLAGYIAVGHTDLRKDIEALDGFIKVKDYAQAGAALPGEVGALGMVRFILTPNGKVTLGGGKSGGSGVRETSSVADLYQLTIFGKGFYGCSRIGKRAVQAIVKPLGYGEDPLNQRSSVGWKLNHVSKVLDDSRGVTIYCAASSLA